MVLELNQKKNEIHSMPDIYTTAIKVLKPYK